MQKGDVRKYLDSITLADIFNLRMLGFACTRAWAYVMFFSTVIHFSVRNDLVHLNSTDTWSSLGLAVFMIVGALVPRIFHQFVHTHAWPRVIVPILMCVATGLLVLIEADWFRQPWCSIITTFSGVGLGFFYFAWGDEYSRLSPTKAAFEALASFLTAALIFPLMIILPSGVAIALTMALPLISGYLAFGKLGIWKTRSLLEPIRVKGSGFMIKAMLSVGIIGFVEALMRTLFIEINPAVDFELYPWVFLIATLISALIVGVTVVSGKHPDYGFAYRIILFALAFIFLLLPIIERGSFMADVLTLTGYCTVSLLVWVVLARIAGSYHLSPIVVFGFGWGLMVAGILCGTFAGTLFKEYFELTSQFLYGVALCSVCALLFANLFLINERSIIRLTNDEENDERGPRPFKDRCEEVALRYKLTEKETEIMILIAKGRSSPRICEQLDISQGTVNTHLTHLYKKMGIHDKQELIDVLEGRCEK